MNDAPDILSAVARYRMIKPDDSILAAVSGGPDSVAMLHALHGLSKETGFKLHCAHLDHGLRGADSTADAEFVAEFSRELGVPAICEKAHLAGSSEEEARDVRYRFLRTAARDIGANKIAVGHTRDDRAESVLLNLCRGAGINGLGSIRPIQDDIIRPLIDAGRSDIENYVRRNKLPYRVDRSNTDTSYARNYVRLEILPALRQRLNPAITDALVRLAETAADQSDLMQGLADTARAACQLGGAQDSGLLENLHPALRSELIRSEIRRAKGDLTDITQENVASIVEALASEGDFKLTLPTGRIFAARTGKAFRVWRESPDRMKPFEISLTVPGSTLIEQLSLIIRAELAEPADISRTGADEAAIDENAVAGRLYARSVRPGDRITPFGMKGSKKLQDVFVDKKIPAAQRRRAVAVCDEEKILWVVGVTASEACRVTDKTKRVIRLYALHGQ